MRALSSIDRGRLQMDGESGSKNVPSRNEKAGALAAPEFLLGSGGQSSSPNVVSGAGS